jgi:sterol desaturase/sphingolipid hydroxylase (fatty acid hydroxylase superfamily)
MYDLAPLLDPAKNPVTYAIPFFLLSLILEAIALTRPEENLAAGERPRTGYMLRDFWTSISMGLGSLVWLTVFKIGTFFIYQWVFLNVAPFHLDTSAWWYWPAVLIALDLAFYCTHRFVHRANIGWAAHQSHHSSVYMNFGTALRQKWNPWFDFVFFLPIPLLGFAPWTAYAAFSISLIYQFCTHTELIGKLPRPIEFIFNTPSHHRVHHGSDPEYLDKNYAGMLIIWDRMFGTFQPEIRRPTYGLTVPVETYNPIKLEYGAFARIAGQVRRARNWRERWGYVFGPPGWSPQVSRDRGAVTPVSRAARR